ncbi:MAG: hypothetical protein V1685_05105 [Parcubacteria group bacterium]
MERKAGGRAIWTIVTLVVVLVAVATWLLIPALSVVIAIDKKVTGEALGGDYSLQGQSWRVDTFWLFMVADDVGRAFYFYPISTTITVAYVLLAVPLWPLGYMAYRRKLRAKPRNFIAYLISTSVTVTLGLWVYGLIPIQLYVR